MLWAQFSAISTHFREKNLHENQCYDPFLHSLAAHILGNKCQFFRWKYFLSITSVPSHTAPKGHSTRKQGCQMVYFQTINPNLCTFWRVWQWKILVYWSVWHVWRPFGLFYSHWVYVPIIWSFGIFLQFWYVMPRKIWQLCSQAIHSIFFRTFQCISDPFRTYVGIAPISCSFKWNFKSGQTILHLVY
jgi:hypothetical protein